MTNTPTSATPILISDRLIAGAGSLGSRTIWHARGSRRVLLYPRTRRDVPRIEQDDQPRYWTKGSLFAAVPPHTLVNHQPRLWRRARRDCNDEAPKQTGRPG